MILYHASDVEVREPEIRTTVYAKDFSTGFYCTANYEQAKRWARRDRNRVPRINHFSFSDMLPYARVADLPEVHQMRRDIKG